MQISYDHMTKANHELYQLQLGQALLPRRSLGGIQRTLAIVEVHKNMDYAIETQGYRNRGPVSVSVGIFTQHQNGSVVVNLENRRTNEG